MFEISLGGPVARLTLNRPEARNAVPASGWTDLADAVNGAVESGARLIMVSGSGTAFSAGADLGDFQKMQGDSDACAAFRTNMRSGLDALRDTPLPTIALIDGPCYGAGVALAMACDMRAVGPDAVFAITPAKMGISYPQEDIYALVRLVGPAQAARLLFPGAAIGAAEALRIGLADFEAEAVDRLIEAILVNDRGSIALLKRGIRLATQGIRSNEVLDRAFDAMIGSDVFAARLAGLRKR